jgi:hypothetical protein
VIKGTLEYIAAQLPNGFHDAEVSSIVVDWGSRCVSFHGVAWMAREGPPEVYRSFELRAEGLCSFLHPDRIHARHFVDTPESILDRPVRVDGFPGWPPEKAPETPPFSEASAYTFYVYEWNDFITLQVARAVLSWVGPEWVEKQ